MVQNILIGFPAVGMSHLVALDLYDWVTYESKQTYTTSTRSLATVLKEAGIVPSVSEVRRNRPDLMRAFPPDFMDCFWVKWGKKKVYVVVGRERPLSPEEYEKESED